MTAVLSGFPYRLVRNVLVVAAALYCSLVTEAVAGYPLPVHTSFLSELSARDQATSSYARSLDLAAGVLVLLAVIVGRQAARLNRAAAGLLISTAAFGAGTLLDSLSPMDCAPSVSQACRDAETSGQASTALLVHEITSTLAGLGSIAMGIFTVLLLRRLGWGGLLAKLVAVVAVGVAVTNVWLGIVTGLESLAGNGLHPPGILQRVAIGLVCLLTATVLPALRQAVRS